MSTEKDEAAPIMPSGEELLTAVQQRAYLAVLDGKGIDKEMNAAMKIVTDVELKKMRLNQDQENATADREQVMALANMLKVSNNNPFQTTEPIAEREPPKAEGRLSDLTVSDENMSTSLGSPSYDDVMGGGEDEE